MSNAENTASAPHIPVLLAPLLRACDPVAGRWLDGTFGAGGYTRGLIEAGADHVITAKLRLLKMCSQTLMRTRKI